MVRRLSRQQISRACVAAVLVAAAVATDAFAQPTPPGELSTLEVPGGRWALGELGIPSTLERGSVIRVLVQRLYDPVSTVRPTVSVLASVQAGLDLAVHVEETARAAAPGGDIALGGIKTKQSRTRVEEAMAAIGARLRERKKVYSVTLETGRKEREVHAALGAMGFDVASVVARLNQGETVTVAVPAEGLPLALSPATWSQTVFGRTLAPRALFAEILRVPNALLFWHGVLAMDAPTRRFLEASPDLVKTLVQESAPLFAAFSAMVTVRDGRVQLAGGPAVQTLWEALVDEPIGSPARFVRRLFTRDDGRLAMFFDLVQRLPAPQRAFATGLWIPRIDDRVARFRALYAAVQSTDTDWKPALAPLKRYPADPWLLLRGLATSTTPTGNGLAGPQQRRFWERAFEHDLPDDPARSLRDIDAEGPFDAAWIVEQVCHQDVAERGARLRQVLMIPRAFPAPVRADLPGVLTAAHGVVRFTALFLVLDRSGVLTSTLAMAAARQADTVDRIGDRDRRALALAALQGGVALVDRAVITGALGLDVARTLVSDLMAVPLRDGTFAAGMAFWLVDRVLPALGPAADVPADQRVVHALAQSAGLRRRVEWEGGHYQVDWTRAERERLIRLRKTQGGYTVDHIAQIVQLMRALAVAPVSPDGVRESMRVIGVLAEATSRFKPIAEIGEPLEASRLLTQVQHELERVKTARDRDRVERAVDRLGRVADWATAHVLAALAYTPHLGDPAGAAARAGDLSLRHRFGVADPSENVRRDDPWTLPTQIDAGGAVNGALVGLDTALARLALRRLSTTSVPVPTLLSTLNAAGIAAQAAMSNPRRMASADLAPVVAALTRGRARVLAARGNASPLDVAAGAAGLAADRRAVLSWMAQHEPDRVVDMFSMSELIAAGGGTVPVPDAFGTPTTGLDGRLQLAWPAAEPWEPYAGRPSLGLMAPLAPDLTLRVAELMTHASLPMELLPGVMAFALQDELDSVPLLATEDWLGLVRFARTLTQERFEDFVSALVGLGILTPVEAGRR